MAKGRKKAEAAGGRDRNAKGKKKTHAKKEKFGKQEQQQQQQQQQQQEEEILSEEHGDIEEYQHSNEDDEKTVVDSLEKVLEGLTLTKSISKSGKENKLSTVFAREPDEIVGKRRQCASLPLRLQLRKETLVSPVGKYWEQLDFPKRPSWHYGMSKQELLRSEEESFKEWILNIYNNYQRDHLCPFEHNIEVWRQLWRVIETSHCIALVVDIRHALLHIPRPLYHYITENLELPMVFVVTKTDLVADSFVQSWMSFLRAEFPKARLVSFAGKAVKTDGKGGARQRRKLISGKATKAQVASLDTEADRVLRVCIETAQSHLKQANCDPGVGSSKAQPLQRSLISEGGDHKEEQEESHRVGEKHEAEEVENSNIPFAITQNNTNSPSTEEKSLPKIGIIGQPNTGKSSLMNAIVEKHVVSVSRTCGHTKHFQTHYILRPKSWKVNPSDHSDNNSHNKGNLQESSEDEDEDEDEDEQEHEQEEDKDERDVQDEQGSAKVPLPSAASTAAKKTKKTLVGTVNTNSQKSSSNSDQEPLKRVAIFCDSPGLIFPLALRKEYIEAASPSDENGALKASFVDYHPRHIYECCGLFPIAQIREPYSAVRLASEYVQVERYYNLKIEEEESEWSPLIICSALADQKGYTLSRSMGAPDTRRAGVQIVYDIADGIVLLQFHPPSHSTASSSVTA